MTGDASGPGTHLTDGMLLAWVRVLSISLCDRNMLRSPFSMYSVTMHSGSDDTHTQSSRMMFGSFRRDMIFISFRKSLLVDGERILKQHVYKQSSVLLAGAELHLAWVVASALSCFTATSTE